MADAGLAWNAAALQRQLSRHHPGIGIEVVAETGSTNSDLLQRVHDATARPVDAPASVDLCGDADDGPSVRLRRSIESAAFTRRIALPPFRPLLLVAEQQTRGRGRLGRTWTSARGASLTFSLAIAIARDDWSGLSLAVGVAVAEALDRASALQGSRGPGDAEDRFDDLASPSVGGDAGRPATMPSIGLKWPNDLWIVEARGRGRKLGGVLIETVAQGAGRVAVIGIGLNVAPLDRAMQPPDAASLRERMPDATAPSTLEAIAAPLLAAISAFEVEGFGAFRERYAARDVLAGLPVRTTQPDAADGIACGIDERGALQVRTADGLLHPVSSGEVSVRLGPAVTTGSC